MPTALARASALAAFLALLVVTSGRAHEGQPEHAASSREAAGARLPWRLSSALRYGPLEQRLFEAHAAGRLPDGDLLSAALVASGINDTESFDAWTARWNEIVTRLKAKLTSGQSDDELAGSVYRFLHGELLSGPYDIQCSDMTAALETGRFNCISATLLYNCLAAEVGLRTHAAATPGHVFSLVILNERRIEVETTCPAWFEILNDPKRLAAFAPPVVEGVSVNHTPLEDSGRATSRGSIQRELGTAELAAIVYYNRGVDFVERRQFAEAVACNFKALQLDPSNTVARGNLLAAVNNWALEEAERGRHETALELIRTGQSISPEHATFAVNFVALHQQWADALCARGQFHEAAAVLEQAAREAPGQPQLDASRFLIYRQWGERLAAREKYDEMFTLFADGRRREPSHAEQWRQAEVVAVRNAALHLAHSGRRSMALWLIEQAQARHPRNDALARTRREILQARSAA